MHGPSPYPVLHTNFLEGGIGAISYGTRTSAPRPCHKHGLLMVTWSLK